MKNKELIEECKKENIKAFEELVKNNMYLVRKTLNKFKYKNQDYDDLLQDGYEHLIKLIKNYISKSYNYPLSQYLNNSLKYYYFSIFENKQNKECLTSNYVDDDFISDLEEKELIQTFEDFVFKTDYLTFMQKNILMARIGYINNNAIGATELSSVLSCSRSNINNKYKRVKELLEIKKLMKNINNKEIEKFHDFYDYFETSKQILKYFMKVLDDSEVVLLKKVWGENFDDINGVKNANINSEETIRYYKIIYKLYDVVTSTNMNDIIEETKINSFHKINKY